MMHTFLATLFISMIAVALFMLCSCTLSFQNIDTHGTATDLVDDTQSASPNVSPNVSVPVSVLPK